MTLQLHNQQTNQKFCSFPIVKGAKLMPTKMGLFSYKEVYKILLSYLSSPQVLL
jgi:hypothetical protein